MLRLPARQLHELGKLNLEEGIVAAKFGAPTKGASRQVPPSAERAERSSLSLLVMVSLSSHLSRVLRLREVLLP